MPEKNLSELQTVFFILVLSSKTLREITFMPLTVCVRLGLGLFVSKISPDAHQKAITRCGATFQTLQQRHFNKPKNGCNSDSFTVIDLKSGVVMDESPPTHTSCAN